MFLHVPLAKSFCACLYTWIHGHQILLAVWMEFYFAHFLKILDTGSVENCLYRLRGLYMLQISEHGLETCYLRCTVLEFWNFASKNIFLGRGDPNDSGKTTRITTVVDRIVSSWWEKLVKMGKPLIFEDFSRFLEQYIAATTRCTIPAGITDECGWMIFSFCKKFHRKIFSKKYFSAEQKIRKNNFQKKSWKVENFEILIFWSKSWKFWYFDFLTYKKSKSQNFQLFNFFGKYFSDFFFRSEIYFSKILFDDFFLQSENFVQPRSSVMPAAVAHQVVDSWKA